ncbi:MAG TPA: META domain-containing protein [Ohtaekwangia sp.]
MKNSFIILMVLLLTNCKTVQTSTVSTSSANLENTYWKLSEMNGMPVVTPADAKEVHFILTSENGESRIKGFAGCNALGGNFVRNGNKINFVTVTTRMMCAERMDVENYLIGVLTNTDSYKISGETLELYQGNTFLAKFDSVYLK